MTVTVVLLDDTLGFPTFPGRGEEGSRRHLVCVDDRETVNAPPLITATMRHPKFLKFSSHRRSIPVYTTTTGSPERPTAERRPPPEPQKGHDDPPQRDRTLGHTKEVLLVSNVNPVMSPLMATRVPTRVTPTTRVESGVVERGFRIDLSATVILKNQHNGSLKNKNKKFV